MAKAKKPIPEGHHTVTPHLFMDDAAKAIDWYKKALGAEEVARALGPDGKIMHAEIRIGDSLIMLNDVMGGARAPRCSAVRPRRSGCTWRIATRCTSGPSPPVPRSLTVRWGPMQDQFWGDRSGSVTDPQGYVWTIATHKEDLTPEEMKQRMDAFMRQFAGAPSQH